MKGLYFYKLVSPYEEDVTKDCKLTINEIDHNFLTLKDAEIKEVSFDKESKIVSLLRNNKEEMRLDLSPMVEGITTNLKVNYDSVDGIITVEYNGEKITINGLITEDNLSSEVLTEVTSDGTLSGLGSKYAPMGIASVERTGSFKPAYKLIDRTVGEQMPNPCHLIKGDRYVTLEEVSEFGYLYSFSSVKKINEDLKNGWRVPTKEDWDNMLNAIEPCDEYRNHNSALANNMLGKVAGRYLKSREHWMKVDNEDCNNKCDCNSSCDKVNGDDEFTIYDNSVKEHPECCTINKNGIDSFGMKIVPAGFSDGCEIVDYFGKRGIYWSSSVINETDVYVKRFDYNKAGVVQNVESPRNLFSLRLVKDYDGSNHLQTEFINGMNYNTVLMPALNTEHGHSIWTTENVAFTNEKYCPFSPNNGEGLLSNKVYFINEWNGFDWERKQLHEGDSIVLMKGLKNEKNIEYRIVDGVLYSVANAIYDDVMNEIKPEIDRLDKIVGSGFTDENGEYISLTDIVGSGFTDENGNRITITDKVKDIDSTLGKGFVDENGDRISVTDKLENEIKDRINGDKKLREDLDKETSDRIESDNELKEALDEETRQREEADILIQEEIDRAEQSIGLDEDGNYIKTDGNYTSEASTISEAIDNLDTSLKIEEESRINQDNTIEENVGLDKDGKYIVKTESNYIKESTTIAESIDDLDDSLKIEENSRVELQNEVNRVEGSIGLDEDGNYIKTDGNYTSEASTVSEAIDNLDTSLKIEEESRINQDNTIEESVGLNEDGTYSPTEGKFTKDSNTIKNAIENLDNYLEQEETNRISQDDKIEESVGLSKDGEHIKTDGNYTSEANTISEEISMLDTSLKNEEESRIEKDDYLNSRLIKEGEQPNQYPDSIAYDCANGVLTLFTEDPSHNIKIKLNGDYGIFPYMENKN